MGLYRGRLTSEEQARVTELQDALINLFFDRRQAVAEGDETRAKELQTEIDGLLREKEDIKKWATVGTA